MSFGLLLLVSASAAITNNFECEKLDSYGCEDVGYCYWDGSTCKKDNCLAIASGNQTTTGCAAGCNVATFYDDGFTNYDECGSRPYLYVCTSRSSSGGSPDNRYISDCFAGMVLSNGVCNKDTYGDANYCANVTDTYDDIGGGTFTGTDCRQNINYSCNERGAANCKMDQSCAIENGVCVRDTCYYLFGSSCTAAAGCKNYSVYYYSGSGSTYQIEIQTTVCGKASNKYGDTQTPNPCSGLRTTYSYSSESPCRNWDLGDPMPSNTEHCTVTTESYCGITGPSCNCAVAANNNCTSASGISGVTCVVKSYEGETYCSDGREYAPEGSGSLARVPLFAILLAAVALAMFAH